MTTCQIICGNCLTELPKLPAESVQACVTSPPYLGLRDYGIPKTLWPAGEYVPLNGVAPVAFPAWEGSLGLESEISMFVGHLVLIFREVRRVLRDDGTLWLNLGDSYAQDGGPGWQELNGDRADRRFRLVRDSVPLRECTRHVPTGLKPKDMLGIPWRVAFALQADGWWLRLDNILAKPSPMPESVTDRPTKSHEYIFLLAKSQRYFYNTAEAREPVTGGAHPRGDGLNRKVGSWSYDEDSHKPIEHRMKPRQNSSFSAAVRKIPPKSEAGQVQMPIDDPKADTSSLETAGKWSKQAKQSSGKRMVDNVKRARANSASHDFPFGCTRNLRSVWLMAAEQFTDSHFATFPRDLARRCIIAGSRPGDTLIDICGGSGTVGEIGQECGRNAILIEISKKYCEMARRRTAQRGMVLV